LIVLTLLVLIALAAPRFGVDSRSTPPDDDPPQPFAATRARRA
jgi:hypothetical protein